MSKETIKLIILIFITSYIALSRNLLIIAFLALIISLFSLLDKKTQKNIAKRIKPLFFISLLIMGFQLIFNTTVDTHTRLYLGIFQGIKIYSLSMLVFVYTSKTGASQILKGLNFLPKKVQLVLTITLSLLPIILDEAEKIRLVQKARGYQSSLINPLKSIFPLIIPLIHRTLRRTEQISLVMQTKGLSLD